MMKTFKTWLEVASREGDWDKLSHMFQQFIKIVVKCLGEKGFKLVGDPQITNQRKEIHASTSLVFEKAVLGIPAEVVVKLDYELTEDSLYNVWIKVQGAARYTQFQHGEITNDELKAKMFQALEEQNHYQSLNHMIVYGLPTMDQFIKCLVKKGLIKPGTDSLLPAAVLELKVDDHAELKGWQDALERFNKDYATAIFGKVKSILIDPSNDRTLEL